MQARLHLADMSGIEIVEAPELVQQITGQVEAEHYSPDDLRFAPSLGFVALQE